MHNSNALLPSGEIYMAAGWSPVKGKRDDKKDSKCTVSYSAW